MKNITLSAPEELIEAARREAAKNGTTLNEEFRKWLSRQAENEKRKRQKSYTKLIKSLPLVNTGGPFTRDEMNER